MILRKKLEYYLLRLVDLLYRCFCLCSFYNFTKSLLKWSTLKNVEQYLNFEREKQKIMKIGNDTNMLNVLFY